MKRGFADSYTFSDGMELTRQQIETIFLDMAQVKFSGPKSKYDLEWFDLNKDLEYFFGIGREIKRLKK